MEIEDIFNFELENISDSTSPENKETTSEAAFRPIPLERNHSENCELIPAEDTTLVTSIQVETEQKEEEALDKTPPSDNKAVPNSPPHQESHHNPGETLTEENRKHPLSPSITYHGPTQKNLKTDRPPTPIPRKREPTLHRSKHQQFKPPPLLKITVKPTPALTEQLTKSGYLPLKRENTPGNSDRKTWLTEGTQISP